jgi:hypothetical protein
MNTATQTILIVAALATGLLGYRGIKRPGWKLTQPNADEKSAIYGVGLIIAVMAGIGFLGMPSNGFGLIWVLAALVLGVVSVALVLDLPAFIHNLLWPATGFPRGRKYQFITAGTLLALSLVFFVFMSIVGAANSGKSDNAAPNNDRGTNSASASPAPSSAPAKGSPSASPSSNCVAAPTDGISDEAYDTTFTKNSIEVWVNGCWKTQSVRVGDPVHVEQWVQANGFEYDLISLGGKKVWTRTPYTP